jgi:DNA invertase Pin-like site-specific DNA recombinase
MLSVMGAFTELEHSLIRERRREGIALAKQRGAYRGRKKTLTPERAAELVQRAASGSSLSVLASDYGISREPVYRYLRQARSAGAFPCGPKSEPRQLDGIMVISELAR